MVKYMYFLPLLLVNLLVSKSSCFSTTIVRPPITKDTLDTKAFVEKVLPNTKSSHQFSTKDVVQNIVVTGATGRTGRYVIEELLNRNVTNIYGFVRDMDKVNDIYPVKYRPSNLHFIQCNLNNETEIIQSIQENQIDAAIWCATGFADAAATSSSTRSNSASSSSPFASFFGPIKRLIFGDTTPSNNNPIMPSSSSPDPKLSIDLIGLPAIAKSLVVVDDETKSSDTTIIMNNEIPELPKIVMCSSAGVTRTIWDTAKKSKYIGAADIPIVRLNPFNILDRKRESEELLRKSSYTNNNKNKKIPYCIVRPCGLNDSWPQNSRPIFTQGDVAVGRLHRRDLAKVLVDTLTTPEATYKTFEVVGLANYPPSSIGIGVALDKLYNDIDVQSKLTDEIVYATYTTMQQLLPGETQDAAALAMGQTYEQLDAGVVGRLGVRGQEDIVRAVPKPTV
jgi:hypothetical protein